jgi:hypothetical protein
MPLLVACRSPADGTPGARMDPPPCPHDATTTENGSVPILPLNPRAPWRAPEDKDNAALGCMSITGGWDPGRTNASPLLLTHPPHLPLLRNDTTTTENITAHDRSPITASSAAGTPGRTTMRIVSLTARLRLRATTGAPSPTTWLSQAGSAGMECRRRRARQTTARAFADPGTGHDDDAVCDDDEDPD